MADKLEWFNQAPAEGFGQYGPEDDLLHPAARAHSTHYGLTETQHFGISIPEERINGFAYFWHHPNLGTVSGGISVWQGVKPHHLAAVVTPDIEHYKTDVGFEVDIVDPLKVVRIRYDDPVRDSAVDVSFTALTPPAMLPSRKHFEQTMRAKGFVKLRGRRFEVDSYSVRDRSWGEARREDPMAIPPICWITGVFSDNLAFNCLVSDHPDLSPDWEGIYQLGEQQTLRQGWLYRSGTYTRIVKARLKTQRNPATLAPLRQQLIVTDDTGYSLDMVGEIVSSCPTGYWPNFSAHMGLIRWQCGGMTCWGDSQETQWTDFVHGMHARREGARG
jgi:hypothetical protein